MKKNVWVIVSIALACISIVLGVFLITERTDNCEIQSLRKEIPRYGSEDIQEVDSFKWKVYAHISEVTDINNELIAYNENILKINEDTKEYVISIYEGSGSSYYDEGKYRIDDDIITLNSKKEYTMDNYDLRFRKLEDIPGSIRYVFIGNTEGDVAPASGDFYVFVWME